jgi:hypothetical protein
MKLSDPELTLLSALLALLHGAVVLAILRNALAGREVVFFTH